MSKTEQALRILSDISGTPVAELRPEQDLVADLGIDDQAFALGEVVHQTSERRGQSDSIEALGVQPVTDAAGLLNAQLDQLRHASELFMLPRGNVGFQALGLALHQRLGAAQQLPEAIVEVSGIFNPWDLLYRTEIPAIERERYGVMPLPPLNE